jgi:hypothetical protein
VNTLDLIADWRKSSRSGDSGDNCVEVAVAETNRGIAK